MINHEKGQRKCVLTLVPGEDIIYSMDVEKQIIDDILSRFIELYHPKEIFLYGSYVWGVPTNRSLI